MNSVFFKKHLRKNEQTNKKKLKKKKKTNLYSLEALQCVVHTCDLFSLSGLMYISEAHLHWCQFLH